MADRQRRRIARSGATAALRPGHRVRPRPRDAGSVLGILSVITLVVIWTGLPFVFGVPALVLAAEGQARAPQQGHGGEATGAAALAGLAMVAAFVVVSWTDRGAGSSFSRFTWGGDDHTASGRTRSGVAAGEALAQGISPRRPAATDFQPGPVAGEARGPR